MTAATSTSRRRLNGLVGLTVIAALVALAIGVFQHSFTRSVDVALVTPRAGLLLNEGADVRLRNIRVGRVSEVRTTQGRSRLTLALDPAQVDRIPADVKARVTPTTVVGAPYVELVAPVGEVSRRISAGTVVPALAAAPDLNQVFARTVDLLRSVPVDDLSVTLSALARALDGRGEEIGRTLSTLDSYVRTLNAHGSALRADLALADPVLDTYADLAGPLNDLLAGAAVTSNTLAVRYDDLVRLLEAADGLATSGSRFLDSTGRPLVRATGLMAPVSRLLGYYAPELPCILKDMSQQALNNKSLGVKYPGAQAIMTLLPGQRGYRYPRDLPQFVDDRGPACYSLPGPPYPLLPYRKFNDNSHANLGDGENHVGQPLEYFGETPGPSTGGGRR